MLVNQLPEERRVLIYSICQFLIRIPIINFNQQFNNQLIIFLIFNNWLLGASAVAHTAASISSTPSFYPGELSQPGEKEVGDESKSLTVSKRSSVEEGVRRDLTLKGN